MRQKFLYKEIISGERLFKKIDLSHYLIWVEQPKGERTPPDRTIDQVIYPLLEENNEQKG